MRAVASGARGGGGAEGWPLQQVDREGGGVHHPALTKPAAPNRHCGGGWGGCLRRGLRACVCESSALKSDLHKPPLRLYHAAHRDTAATQATVWCIFICRHSSARLRLFSFVFPDLDCVVGCHATRCDDHLARVAAHRQHRAAMPNPAAHTRHTASPRRQRQAVERLAGVQRCLKPSMSLGSTRERE